MKNFLISAMSVMVICLSSFQQYDSEKFVVHQNSIVGKDQNRYTKQQIEMFIRDIFSDQADELVFNSASGRLELITDFLNRFTIQRKTEYQGKNFPLLSELKLQNKYNASLKRDENYNPATFNPLKYNFPMTSKSKIFYRIDNTDYIIIINPIK